jgi:hypothetical protein
MTATIGTPPWVWSEAAYVRALSLSGGPAGVLPPFTVLCTFCGLPSSQFRPSRNARSWGMHCERCSTRAFVRYPRLAFAPSALFDPLLSRGLPALCDGVARLDRMGAAMEATAIWDEVVFGQVRRLQLRTPVACLYCGEVGAASARKDRYGLDYLSCEACISRTFFRHEHGLRMALAWTAWMATPGGSEAWMTAFEQGRATWKGWLDLTRLDPGVAEAAGAEETDTEREAR